MSESGDYSGSEWSGHDFRGAYDRYDRHAGRSYADAKASGKAAGDLIPERLTTVSPSPLVIRCDVTGSMHEAPKTMFAKLPLLAHEVRTEYLGEHAELSFGAIGDATCDSYPMQLRPFAALTAPPKRVAKTPWEDPEIAKRLQELVIEGGGGGQQTESYELTALYDARLIEMPNAVRPIWIGIGDEMPYPETNLDEVQRLCRIHLDRALPTADVFAELQRKFAVYFIQLPYNGEVGVRDGMTEDTRKIRARWVKLLGEDRVAMLLDPSRIVDVILGILATETGRVGYFRGELEGRQDPNQVETVYKSLATVHRLPADAQKQLGSGKSTLHRPTGGTRGKGLL
ncbi:MAG: hypothetical protein Q7S02_02765 [bacterium]|nr:hypothetical protein [bacterium]